MEDTTYINILTDSLKKKGLLLDQMIGLTKEQEEIIASSEANVDRLEEIFSEKDNILKQLDLLDSGFDKVYQHVKEGLQENKDQYKEHILVLQDLIRMITEKSSTLQVMELQNRNKFQAYFSGRKKDIKNFKISSQTASKYYKSVVNLPQDEAHFLDKKK